jgi:hypothetical protein
MEAKGLRATIHIAAQKPVRKVMVTKVRISNGAPDAARKPKATKLVTVANSIASATGKDHLLPFQSKMPPAT